MSDRCLEQDSAVLNGPSISQAVGAAHRDDARAEVVAGLSREAKTLPCKLFYDERGSQLFDQICDLPEYYLTRTELQIMRDHAGAIADAIGDEALIVEYGSGSSLKTRILLDHLRTPAGYIPIDISGAHLARAARALAVAYPAVRVHPVTADFTRPFRLPETMRKSAARTVAYFPGSTIGNFEPAEALTLLRSIRTTCGAGSGLLIGVDLNKDPATLHAAYNDAAGVTAAFNLNLLRRLNHDLGSDFQLDRFAHYAFINPRAARVEMHLISSRSQSVDLGQGIRVKFRSGESIHTESCHKYTLESFRLLAGAAGYRRVATWTDPQTWFSVQYLVDASFHGS